MCSARAVALSGVSSSFEAIVKISLQHGHLEGEYNLSTQQGACLGQALCLKGDAKHLEQDIIKSEISGKNK